MYSNFWPDKLDEKVVGDHISHLRMSLLTTIGRSMLPPGFWGATSILDCHTVLGGKPVEPTLYLTFDDGPNPATTPALLRLLEEEDAHATFFLIGANIARHKELAAAMHKSGHEIGNHSFNHEFMPSLTVPKIEDEIYRTNELLLEAGDGKRPAFFRPPYGIIDKRGAQCVKAAGLSIIYWSAVPEDWRHVGAERVVGRVVKKFSDGAIIVLHEGTSIAKQTVDATREIITRAKAAGYKFASLHTR